MQGQGRRSGAPVLIGVGGSFEMVGGILRRAPRFIRRIGCEWLYRLLLEPRRLWKRYLIGNCRFLWIVLRQSAGQFRKPPHGSAHATLEGTPAARACD
jgi:N-acetylglucosaminyldiphosphoundecaprenol N-acetyl-beta-D-mannosaminyltransferase